MAIEFVGATNASTTTNALPVALPSGVQAGDVLVLIVRSWQSLRASGPSYGVTAEGWTLRLINADRGGNSNLYVFTGVADPSSVYTPVMSFGANGNHHANMLAFRGVDHVNPVNAVAQAYSASGANSITPSVTTTVPDCLIVRAVAAGFSLSNGSCTWVSTVDELTDTRSSAGYSYMSTAASMSGPSPGPAGTATATYSTAGYGIMATVALAPKPAARLHLGTTPVPLMLGNTEVEIEGP
ncbi:hypothetical protein GS966_19950 [Rhodococcus hoagii]|nr:hypothetical protein [Prescottella equi]NKS73148.1 hypothetical protein [Prescottella equi]NKZ92200.1 hypothetical protein [Prescottella equi]